MKNCIIQFNEKKLQSTKSLLQCLFKLWTIFYTLLVTVFAKFNITQNVQINIEGYTYIRFNVGTYEVFNVYLSPFFKRSSFCSRPILTPFTATTFFLNVCKTTSPSLLLICPILLQNYLFKHFKNKIIRIQNYSAK